jgi:hypothetical protein
MWDDYDSWKTDDVDAYSSEHSPFPSGIESQLDSLNLALDARISAADIRAHAAYKAGDGARGLQVGQHLGELVELQQALYEDPYGILWCPF